MFHNICMKFCKESDFVQVYSDDLHKDKITRVIVRLTTCSRSKLKLAGQRYFLYQSNRSIQGHGVILNQLSQKKFIVVKCGTLFVFIGSQATVWPKSPWPPSALTFWCGYCRIYYEISPSMLCVTEYTAIFPRHI